MPSFPQWLQRARAKAVEALPKASVRAAFLLALVLLALVADVAGLRLALPRVALVGLGGVVGHGAGGSPGVLLAELGGSGNVLDIVLRASVHRTACHGPGDRHRRCRHHRRRPCPHVPHVRGRGR
eukprot:10146880-Alexandrium_andersonii.AAC.2